MNQTNTFSFPNFTWFMGVVEDRTGDPMKLGRVRVRVFGYHTKDRGDIKTEQLMWAVLMQPVTSAAISGVGTSPTGLLEGSHVFGFFADGGNAQAPIIMGSYGGIPETPKSGEGFADPSGTNPKFPGEADTNRLARNEQIGETVVQKKRDNLDTANRAFGGTWREPQPPYAAKYPYNHVRETESGHIQEFDDTVGAERYHLYHPKGTFVETGPDGTTVTKIVKDNYTIIAGDEYVHVVGKSNITVTGDASILVEGNANMEVNGNSKETVHGNKTLQVDGNFTVQVNGTHSDTSSTHRIIKAPRIDLN